MSIRFLAPFLLIGCTGDIGPARDLIAHEGRIDLGTAPLGNVVEFAVELDHTAGQRPVHITDVEVVGEAFSVPEGPLPQVRIKGKQAIPLFFSPTEEGDHHAEVIVSHDGASGIVTFYVEATAVRPLFQVWPPVMDFGPKEAGDVATKQVRITNYSRWDLEISSLSYGRVVEEVRAELPILAIRGKSFVLEVEIEAEDEEPARDDLIFRIGDLELDRVRVLVNDCEQGDPALYDRDADGVTSCEGDCDDDDPYVHVGADEIADNGIDDDCDDFID